jgi:hypothetical protein
MTYAAMAEVSVAPAHAGLFRASRIRENG